MPIVFVEMELVAHDAPLTWSSDSETQQRLYAHVSEWLRAHPIKVDDTAMVVVTREIFMRIHATIQKLDPDTTPTIEYRQIVTQIDHDTRIIGELRKECIETLDTAWQLIAVMLEFGFTTYTPDDDS